MALWLRSESGSEAKTKRWRKRKKFNISESHLPSKCSWDKRCKIYGTEKKLIPGCSFEICRE